MDLEPEKNLENESRQSFNVKLDIGIRTGMYIVPGVLRYLYILYTGMFLCVGWSTGLYFETLPSHQPIRSPVSYV